MPRQHRPARYGRWTGGPDPLAPPGDLSEALDAIGADVMAGYSPRSALREFLRRGGQGREGLDDLARRVQQRRRELLGRHRLDGTLVEAQELLEQAVLAERKQLARACRTRAGDRLHQPPLGAKHRVPRIGAAGGHGRSALERRRLLWRRSA